MYTVIMLFVLSSTFSDLGYQQMPNTNQRHTRTSLEVLKIMNQENLPLLSKKPDW